MQRARTSLYSETRLRKERASLSEVPKAAQPKVYRARTSFCSDAPKKQNEGFDVEGTHGGTTPAHAHLCTRTHTYTDLVSVDGCTTTLRSAPRTGDRCEVTPPHAKMIQQMSSLPPTWVTVGSHPPSEKGCATTPRSAPRTGDRCKVNPPAWKDNAANALPAPKDGGNGGNPLSVEGSHQRKRMVR